VFGYSRDSFYRFKKLNDEHGAFLSRNVPKNNLPLFLGTINNHFRQIKALYAYNNIILNKER